MFGIASARQGRSHQRKLGRWRNGLWIPKLYTDPRAGLRVFYVPYVPPTPFEYVAYVI